MWLDFKEWGFYSVPQPIVKRNSFLFFVFYIKDCFTPSWNALLKWKFKFFGTSTGCGCSSVGRVTVANSDARLLWTHPGCIAASLWRVQPLLQPLEVSKEKAFSWFLFLLWSLTAWHHGCMWSQIYDFQQLLTILFSLMLSNSFVSFCKLL